MVGLYTFLAIALPDGDVWQAVERLLCKVRCMDVRACACGQNLREQLPKRRVSGLGQLPT